MTKNRDEYELQLTWRTMSQLGVSSGFIVWDVLQVVGPSKDDSNRFMATLDNEQLYVDCYHFWTRASAEKFLNEEGWYQLITVIPEKKQTVSIHQIMDEATIQYLKATD